MCRLATEENAKQSQTYNLPGVEVKGAVPQLSWITSKGLEFEGVGKKNWM